MSELLLGQKVRLKIQTTVGQNTSYKLVASEISCGLDITFDKIELANKDNGDWKKQLLGSGSASVPWEGHADFTPAADTLGYADLLPLTLGKQKHNFQIVFDAAKDVTISFPGYFDGFKTTGQTNDGVKVSFNVLVDEQPTLQVAP
nr:hypothetical protein [uncultured Arsenicibacter sp.]